MTVALALGALMLLGSGAYVGGRAGRRDGRPAASLPIAWLASIVGVAVAGAALVVFRPEHVRTADVAWSVVAGLTIALGRPLLYLGLARGPVVVFAPVYSLVALMVPVVAGIVIGDGLGLVETAGVAVALPAVALLSSRGELPTVAALRASPAVATALITGIMLGLAAVAFSLTEPEAGLVVVLLSQAAASVVMPAIGLAGPAFPRIHRRVVLMAGAVGLIEVVGIMLAIAALQRGPIAVAAAITALAPALLMIYARVLDREAIYRLQLYGAALGLAAVLLFAFG